MDNQDKNLDKPLLDVSNILTPLQGRLRGIAKD